MKTKNNSNLRKNININSVIQLYLKEGKTLKQTATILNISIPTLVRFNKENGITKGLRNLKDNNTIQNLKESITFHKDKPITEVCRLLHINYNTYKRVYKNIDKTIKNKIDESIIDIKNKDFCYLLGLLMADGHVGSSITYVCQCDAKYLKKLQKIIGHTGNITKATNTDNPCYKLTITSKNLKEFLNKYNIPSNKKLNAPYIDCGDLDTHFVRGVFDGDGCLYYAYISGKLKQRRVEISTGSSAMKDGICSFLLKYGINHTVYEDVNKNICYKIFIDVISDIIKFLNLLYKDKNNSFLDRKYYTFIKFKKLVDMNKQVNDIVDGLRETF